MEIEKPLIGIPVSNDLECFQAMLYSLLQSTDWYERIIIVESGSQDGTAEFCDYMDKTENKIEVIHTEKEGPLKAYNKLFEIAVKENKDLFITQSDVLFPKLYKRDWMQVFSKYANNPEVGLVVPLNGGGHSGRDYLNHMYWVGGWATYFSKKCWEIFKGYDENYPKGYGVDVDCTFNITQRYKIAQVNYWVDHHMMNAREHDNSQDTEKAKQDAGRYFRKKWKIE